MNYSIVLSKQVTRILAISLLTAFNLLSLTVKPSYAETCLDFPVIGAEGTEVTKTVSKPGIPGPFGLRINNNWNTDFSVVPLQLYDRYVIKLRAENSGNFHIRVFLKYNDNTSDNIYDQQVNLSTGQTVEITGTSRKDTIPFQVNIFVGEIVSIGRTYTVSAKGCI